MTKGHFHEDLDVQISILEKKITETKSFNFKTPPRENQEIEIAAFKIENQVA